MSESFDWTAIDLVVFDVDGTLYRQSGMRKRMARDLLINAVCTLSLRNFKVLRFYRKCREELGEKETSALEQRTLEATAEACGCDIASVQAIVSEWMDTRPLPYLASLRYPGLPELFAGLKAAGKTIGILSDFPATDKMAALNLPADIVVSAADPDVGLSKPHPKGLETVIARANTTPARSVLIGDRWERDGLAAQRAGATSLIRSEAPLSNWTSFTAFDDLIFAPVLA